MTAGGTGSVAHGKVGLEGVGHVLFSFARVLEDRGQAEPFTLAMHKAPWINLWKECSQQDQMAQLVEFFGTLGRRGGDWHR